MNKQEQIKQLFSKLSPLANRRFLHWLLADPKYGALSFATAVERPVIEAVVSLYDSFFEGNIVPDEELYAACVALDALDALDDLDVTAVADKPFTVDEFQEAQLAKLNELIANKTTEEAP